MILLVPTKLPFFLESVLLVDAKVQGWCTIKVEIRQAYDLVEWWFIIQCLQVAGFPTKYVNWVRESALPLLSTLWM